MLRSTKRYINSAFCFSYFKKNKIIIELPENLNFLENYPSRFYKPYAADNLFLKKKNIPYNKLLDKTKNSFFYKNVNFKGDLFKGLTKKQKKKIKLSKLHKVVVPSYFLFKKYPKFLRNLIVVKPVLNKKVLISDGYSWHLIKLNPITLGYKLGSLCFKTRAISPIKLLDKGKLHLSMAQKTTYKIKRLKIKRKK